MKLFAFYIGGSMEGSLIEMHDVRILAAPTMNDCIPMIKETHWGLPEKLHLDCWGELTSADGYNISLDEQPSQQAEQLFFVNLGGYLPDDFNEQHKNIFVVAENERAAKTRALAIAKEQCNDWQKTHRDYVFEVEEIWNVQSLIGDSKFHIHLQETDTPTPFVFDYGYNPIGRKG